jgi:hypothetical protein
MGDIASVSRGPNKLPNAHEMQPRLPFRIWIFHQLYIGFLDQTRNIGQGQEIVDPLAVMLEVEGSISKSIRLVDDGLPNLVDLFL